jgi:hypothetical protein
VRNQVVGALRSVADRVADTIAERVVRQLEPVVRQEVDRMVRTAHEVEFRSRRDLLAAGERDAALAAAKFVNRWMPTGRAFHDPQSTLSYALEIAPPIGMALEFGVYTGRSLRMIAAARRGVEVFGFDSFKGLPEVYRPHVRDGAFALDRLPEIDGAELVVGWFDETLPWFMAEHPGPVAFLHIDGDLYSSAKIVLEHVGPRLQAGSVIVFDEFFNYPGWEQHEFRAWQEYADASGMTATYEAYTSNNEQVVVRVLEPVRSAGIDVAQT